MLSGCSLFDDSDYQNPTEGDTIPWQKHQQKLQALSTWTLTGKLAIFLKDERETANVYWQQHGNNYTIELTSFIGTRILSIKKNALGVEVINNDGDIFTGQDTEILIQKIVPGLNLPVSALQQWIKGNPVNASYTLNKQNRVTTLSGKEIDNSIWQVSYQQYQAFSEVVLPRKLNLNRDNIRLKISINQWQLNK